MSAPSPEQQLRAIAQCCMNSAAMLWIADESPITDPEKRRLILQANKGQARLLEKAARMADELAEARS
jgi:hypothetical protein